MQAYKCILGVPERKYITMWDWSAHRIIIQIMFNALQGALTPGACINYELNKKKFA